MADVRASRHRGEIDRWPSTTTFSPANPCPKAIPTRSATAFPTRSSISILGADPQARVAVETLVTTNRVVLAGEVRGPASITSERADRGRAPGDQGHRLRAGRLPLEERRGRHATSTSSRPTSPSASTPPATRTRAPATRASCSATPAARPTELMPAPIYYAHHILQARWPRRATAGQSPLLGPDAKSQVTLQLRERQAGRAPPRSWSRPSMPTGIDAGRGARDRPPATC